MARLSITPDDEEEIGGILAVLLPHLRSHPDLEVDGPTTLSHSDGETVFKMTLTRHDR